MSTNEETFDATQERLRIARNLSAIEDMFGRLHGEAINRAGDPNIPGGAAMVMLGPGSNVEAFNYAQLSELFGRTKGVTEVAIKGDIEPPLSFLASWADIIREARGGEPSGRRATIADEIRYIRSAVDWILAVDHNGDPWWMQVLDFTDGLSKVRSAMENALKDGVRSERINAECKRCPKPTRLIVLMGDQEDGSADSWKCPRCSKEYDVDGVRECWHQMFVQRGPAAEWVPLRRAAAALNRATGTVYKWTLSPTDSQGDAIPDRMPIVESEKRADGVLWVRWADVRAADDTRKRRKNRLIA